MVLMAEIKSGEAGGLKRKYSRNAMEDKKTEKMDVFLGCSVEVFNGGSVE